MTKRRTGGFRGASVAGWGFLLIALAIPAVAGAQGRIRLPGSRAPFAKPGAFVRRAAASERVDFAVYLGLRDAAGAEAFVKRVSDPASLDYAHYLTPAQFRQRFSRSASDATTVESWLSAQGFVLGRTPANRLWVPASGSVAQVERAFGVRLNYYRVGKHVLRAPSGTPSVPRSLSGIARGVLGLDQELMEPLAPPPPAFVNAGPCSTYWAERIAQNKPKAYSEHRPWIPCGYTPSQLQGAYGIADAITAGNDGSGVTVGIVDAFASPTIQADLDTYSARHELPQLTIQQVTRPPQHGPDNIQSGWYVEETLDVESVHSMAPGADILFEGAAGPYGFYLDAAVLDVVDNAKAQIISNSYGSGKGEQPTAANIESRTALFMQAGAEGIGVYFSSGDSGDNLVALGQRSVEWPASNPFVIAVGGTSLAVGSSDEYLFETGWGTDNSYLVRGAWDPTPPGDFFYGGGGGTSKIFDEPDYQQGVVPGSLSGYWGGENRVVPDIAALGDPNTGFVMGETQTFPNGKERYGEFRVGGTSLSSPLLAGIMAIADQRAGFAHGFANPAFYGLAGTDAFHDIVDPASIVAVVRASYNNGVNGKAGKNYALRTMNQTGTLQTIPGYDDVTGVGTPNGEAFLNALSHP